MDPSKTCGARSFDRLVGTGEEQGRDGEAERFSRLEIEDELEPGWLHDGKLAGRRAFQNPAGIEAGLALRLPVAAAIAHEAT
jgi:hypothetical protein